MTHPIVNLFFISVPSTPTCKVVTFHLYSRAFDSCHSKRFLLTRKLLNEVFNEYIWSHFFAFFQTVIWSDYYTVMQTTVVYFTSHHLFSFHSSMLSNNKMTTEYTNCFRTVNEPWNITESWNYKIFTCFDRDLVWGETAIKTSIWVKPRL